MFVGTTHFLLNTRDLKISVQKEKHMSFYSYSPFRLTSIFHSEKFEFESPTIIEDKQCKQTERFLAMEKGSNYFLSLDDKFKQRYKVKTNNIQSYDAYQIKKKELPANINKFSSVQL